MNLSETRECALTKYITNLVCEKNNLDFNENLEIINTKMDNVFSSIENIQRAKNPKSEYYEIKNINNEKEYFELSNKLLEIGKQLKRNKQDNEIKVEKDKFYQKILEKVKSSKTKSKKEQLDKAKKEYIKLRSDGEGWIVKTIKKHDIILDTCSSDMWRYFCKGDNENHGYNNPLLGMHYYIFTPTNSKYCDDCYKDEINYSDEYELEEFELKELEKYVIANLK
jgi:hypothetical protein